ncbi:MAG TPA: alginate lyase family protein, partial [Puia sp.]|nr:alginate lyase family protein [Puia sp.]
MKNIHWTLIFLLTPFLLRAQTHTLEKLWETDSIIAVPESVLPDASHSFLFVSLIDGGGWDADGKGGVGKLGLDGKHYDYWIHGLNAPKGLGRYGNRLYVADISYVAVIDIAKGRIMKKIAIAGATGLNDITVDDAGIVYVSDSKAGKVYRIQKDVPTLYMDDLPGANGLKTTKTGLYICARKAVLFADASKDLKKITDLPNGGDGIELAGNGDLVVSEWVGYVYYVHADGRKELLLDTHLASKNTADIHYDQANHILYIPEFNGKAVSAWRLKTNATTLLWDEPQLDSWKLKLQTGDTTAARLMTRLRQQADHLLDLPALSVMDKQMTPPSGDKHDYMSQAPYFWYDSSKPNGLPYLRRDGQRNPETYKITDHRNLGELGSRAQTLALAWKLTGDNKYAEKAAGLLHHWFFDKDSRMNPNLEYSQGIPGINTGRGIGIIESIPLIHIADAAILLQGAPAWTAEDMQSLRSWYAQFLHWMLDSKHGQDEHHATNNHGTWYLAQATDFALFTGDTATAKKLAEEGKVKMNHQVQADGRMPEELARTNSLHYSTYNLEAFFTLASIARHAGVDLWQYKDQQNAGIRTAFDWLLPYALGQKKWEYQEISAYNKDELYPLLLQAYSVYADQQYLTDAKLIHPNGGNPVADLLLPQQPVTPNPGELVRRVADNILSTTTYRFVNTKTNETYTATKGLAPSPDIKAQSKFNKWQYVNGVLAVGMMQTAAVLHDAKYSDYARKNYEFIFDNLDYFKKQYDAGATSVEWRPVLHIGSLDDCGSMAAGLLDVYATDKKPVYMDYLQRVGDYIRHKQVRFPDGTLARNNPRKMTLWADDLYMSVPFLARMGKTTGDAAYLDFAIRQVEAFNHYIYDSATGLYFHAYYNDENMNGVAHWGRCNGWVALAQTALLDVLPAGHPKREELRKMLLRQIQGFARYQDSSGMWHQILDKSDSYLESSV